MEKIKIVHGVKMKAIGKPLENICVFPKDSVEVGTGRVSMPALFADWYPSYATFPVRHDDIWVDTFPKSGTTWSQELVWCLFNDPDSPESKAEIMQRFPFFELDSLLDPNIDLGELPSDHFAKPGNSWKLLKQLTPPRLIKSHLPKDLLPNQFWQVKPKVVYVCRDPRDVCVSYYFHFRKLEGYTGTFDRFVELFLDEKLDYTPIWAHILGFWRLRNEPNVLFLRFEDMKQDLSGAVRRVADFLEVEVDEAKVTRLAHHCSFDQMKANPATNLESFVDPPNEQAKGINFMRKGQVGDWKNHLTEAQQAAFKEWTSKHLQGSDFPYYQDY